MSVHPLGGAEHKTTVPVVLTSVAGICVLFPYLFFIDSLLRAKYNTD